MLFVDTQFLQHGLAQFLCHLLGVYIEDGATHDDGLVEESFGLGHAHQRAHLAATARLTEDSHIIGVAAKVSDIVAHPLEGLHRVEHTHIA